ncbi:unnamed protein product [Amoebophrya sp. A120]|nr:unnamed protein product [Amoebophrya sp. A120]|eukprot:GSA120T00004591001.1
MSPRSRSRSRSRSVERRRSPEPRRENRDRDRSISRERPRGGNGGGDGGTTLWVGGLPESVREDDVRDVFSKFGKIVDVRMKNSDVRKGPPFCFVEFTDRGDAQDAIKDLDQARPFRKDDKITVQFTAEKGSKGKGKRRHDSRDRGRGKGRYDSRDRGRRYSGGKDRDRKGISRAKGELSEGAYKITLEGIPNDMTWTELKEMGRQHVGGDRYMDVTFARTFRNRQGTACGILEFKSRSMAQDLVDKLDDRKIKGWDERLRVKMGDHSWD